MCFRRIFNSKLRAIERRNLVRKEVIPFCPVCQTKLKVVRLKCNHCDTAIEGEFELDKFNYLSREDKAFIEIFIKNRGNIKEIEKEMGISYPTVKKNLDKVIGALGYSVPVSEEPQIDKQSVLEMLQKGEIDAKEALRRLKGEE